MRCLHRIVRWKKWNISIWLEIIDFSVHVLEAFFHSARCRIASEVNYEFNRYKTRLKDDLQYFLISFPNNDAGDIDNDLTGRSEDRECFYWSYLVYHNSNMYIRYIHFVRNRDEADTLFFRHAFAIYHTCERLNCHSAPGGVEVGNGTHSPRVVEFVRNLHVRSTPLFLNRL